MSTGYEASRRVTEGSSGTVEDQDKPKLNRAATRNTALISNDVYYGRLNDANTRRLEKLLVAGEWQGLWQQ